MTQKDKILKAFLALQFIKSKAINLEREAESYDMKFHRSYTGSIIKKCDELLKELKQQIL